MMRSITLHGRLAEQFGSTPIELEVDDPVMAIAGLQCAFPGFEQAIRENPNYYFVKVDHDKKTISCIDDSTFEMRLGTATDLHLIPEVEGSGFEIAAMLGYAAGTLANYVIGTIISIGISMAMNAIVSSLSSMPSTSNGNTPAAERPSFIFTRPTNVTSPGNPVPLVYGRTLVGSIVISAGITTEQVL